MTSAEEFRLGEWLVQPSLNRVSRGGESASLQPRFMDLLVHLAQVPGKVVSKDEILEAVWAKEFVSEGTLTHAIAVIRQTLGDDVRKPEYIETIPTRGYRLIAPVIPVAAAMPAAPAEPAPPARPRVGNRRALASAVAVALVAAAVWALAAWIRGRHPGSEGGGAVKVVVMPFQNLGPLAREYVALGITDDITTRLASVRGIVVSSRTSAAYCAKEGRSSRQIADELGVRFILEGTVRWDDDQAEGSALRVNAQLIRAADDTLLWGQGYRSDVVDVGEVGAVIARQAVEELGVPLRGAEQTRLSATPTDDPDAYQAYLCGMRYHDLDGREQLGLAAAMFERAAKLDPAFALAYAQLSVTHSRIYSLGIDPSAERLKLAEEAARRALELRPSLPEAHLAFGAVEHLGRRDFESALAEYRIAGRDLPNDSELVSLVADVHRRQARWAEARREIERVVEADPGNYGALLALGDTLLRMRAYREADRAFQRATNVAPDRIEPYLRRFWNYLCWDGGTDRAERVLTDAPLPDSPQIAVCRSYLRYLARDYSGAATSLAQVPSRAQIGPFRPSSKELLECIYLDAAKDRAGADRACATAVAALERQGARDPADPWVQLGIARAQAVLGRSAEAVRAANAAAGLCPISKDAVDGATCMVEQSEALARAGQGAQAASLVVRLLTIPSPLSVPWLRLDPAWDPIRNDPRLTALLAAPAHS